MPKKRIANRSSFRLEQYANKRRRAKHTQTKLNKYGFGPFYPIFKSANWQNLWSYIPVYDAKTPRRLRIKLETHRRKHFCSDKGNYTTRIINGFLYVLDLDKNQCRVITEDHYGMNPIAEAELAEDDWLENVDVEKKFQRRGIATNMIKLLVNRYPNFKVPFHGNATDNAYYCTQAGKALVEACIRKNILEPHHYDREVPLNEEFTCSY